LVPKKGRSSAAHPDVPDQPGRLRLRGAGGRAGVRAVLSLRRWRRLHGQPALRRSRL